MGRGQSAAPGSELLLAGSEARHLLVARRAEPGDRLELFDGCGGLWSAELVSGSEAGALCRVISELEAGTTNSPRLTVATAVPRTKRMSFLVEKCAELGVGELLPVSWKRSPRSGSRAAVERWRRLAESAAKQSRQSTLMHVESPLAPENLGARLEAFEACLLLDPRSGLDLRSALETIPAGARIAAIVGPEGGFTAPEETLLTRLGENLQRVRMGNSVLRVETAAITAAALILVGSASR